MNILYIAQRVPYPPDRGDKLAAYHAIRYLARKHAVTVAALADSAEELGHARSLEAIGVTVEVARRGRFAARWSALNALVTGEPLSVSYYRSQALGRRILECRRRTSFDVVVTFSSSMGQYVTSDCPVPLIADFVDMDSRKWALYAAASRWPLSWVYATEARRLLRHERWLARLAQCTLVRTEAELEDCRRLIPGGRFRVLANGVDLEYFSAVGPRMPSRRIVFTGVMDYFPNVQAVTFFCDRIFPLVRNAVPDATFAIVGSRPSRTVRALAARPGVSVTGRVPDVRPYLQQAAAAVAPLLIARGVQNKVLEAMAMGTPVVATSSVLQGVGAPPGEGVLVGDTPEIFAQEVTGVLCDQTWAGELGRRGRRFVEKHCVWDVELSRLDVLLEEAIGHAPTSHPVTASVGSA
jgi:sugar transferase (PEP-CTERM/EpsH1 system associated)